MKVSEVTIGALKNRQSGHGGQLVIVDFNNDGGNCLVFLVDDCDKPEVPGYPACSIERFDSVETAREEISSLYKNLNYYPKYNKHISVFTKG